MLFAKFLLSSSRFHGKLPHNILPLKNYLGKIRILDFVCNLQVSSKFLRDFLHTISYISFSLSLEFVVELAVVVVVVPLVIAEFESPPLRTLCQFSNSTETNFFSRSKYCPNSSISLWPAPWGGGDVQLRKC